ncbi:uncharacterized protein EI97DRAFT_274521 [Westerdykella ornata]|uniref:Uncharacterized protein n=1 Tax=Westerdykella ornata TaxID=318751 RepID=A0A6A6JQ75_WESOR|nr:uncharacterized protein EI97DRAFT_274521 [Westerdykella ornata]KAF2277836.1 hypothetical protein EI97DRAFT_274521 [Westerdykella ornata]
MFMTHIWEGPTMVTPQNLQTQILDSLRYGDAGVPQGLTAFTGAGGDFENIPENKVRAFIITPYRRQAPANPSHNDLEYPYEVGKIQDLLKDVLGRTDTLIIPYVAMFPDPDLDYPFGKVLIQYDPVAAWLGRADGSCDTQVAGIELWFEANPMHRYRDRWFPFPNQILPMRTLPRRSNSGDGNEIRLLRGRKVTDADEEEWKEYESIMKRQGGGSCSLPSAPGESAPASSTSPPSSTGQTPTTLQTSFVSSSSEGGTTSPEELPPSTQEPPSSTKEQPSETSTPASDPTPTPTPSKAVSIIIRHVNDDDDYYNSWTFFETSVGSQADGCENPVLDDKATRWSDRDAINNPPWPHGTFTMTLFAEENCQYLNDGKGAGILHCPSMGEGNNVGCKEDAEKSQVSAITQCLYSLALSISYHRAVSCEY